MFAGQDRIIGLWGRMRTGAGLGVALFALLISFAPLLEAAEQPNVIFVFADEHRYQSMAFSEMPEIETPTMDKMAAEGVSFRNAIANYPVCSPHRAILMSGRWPYQTGVTDNAITLADTETTLGDVFQEAGYTTGYVGKWHLGGVHAEPYGFEWSRVWSDTNTHYDRSFFHDGKEKSERLKGYNATLMMDQAIGFIGDNADSPFFLMVSLNPPHTSFKDAPAEKMALYPEGSLPRRPNTRASTGDGFLNVTKDAGYRGYHAHVSAVDDELARLLAAIGDADLWGRTIVVYSSDHGSMLGSHGVGSKRQAFEESIRIPFIVYGPGIIEAQPERTELLGAIDMMPTLLGGAGLPVPEGCEGRDFSPWLFGKRGPDPDHQLIMHVAKENASRGNNHPAPLFRGLRTKRHTYSVGPEGPMYLFDNREDPYQLSNLVESSTHQALRVRMHETVEQEFNAIGDPFFQTKITEPLTTE